MKVTNERILEIWNVFRKLDNKVGNVFFFHKVLQNKKNMEPKVDILQEAHAPLDKTLEYHQKRVEICEDFCLRDENNKPKIKKDPQTQAEGYDIDPAQQEEFDKLINDLKEEYKEVIEAQEQRDKEFKELLKEEVDVNFKLFKLEEFPHGVLTLQEQEILFDLIEEE